MLRLKSGPAVHGWRSQLTPVARPAGGFVVQICSNYTIAFLPSFGSSLVTILTQ